jgi:hypothetical protein
MWATGARPACTKTKAEHAPSKLFRAAGAKHGEAIAASLPSRLKANRSGFVKKQKSDG